MRPHNPEQEGIWKHPIEDWRRLNSINLDGAYHGIKAAAKSMVFNNVKEGKSIVIISSGAGYMGGTGIGYTATSK